MSDIKIRNAIIESARINNDDHNLLSAWLSLDYGGSGQGFGGYAEPATIKYQKIADYARDGHRSEPHRPSFRCFCDRHSTRGDCGLDDADSNYIPTAKMVDGAWSALPTRERGGADE